MKALLLTFCLLAAQVRAFVPTVNIQTQLHGAPLSSSRFADHHDAGRRHVFKSWVAASIALVPAIAQAKVSLLHWSYPLFMQNHHCLTHYHLFRQDLKEDYRQGTAALSEMDDAAPVPREAYKKLSDGVIYADLRTGTGEQAQQGSRVNLQWVLRKSNGYFVDSSERNGSMPFIFTISDGTAIQGVDEGVRGMKVGGVRRLLIPPSVAYVDGLEDGKPGPLPVGFGPRQQMRRVQNFRKDVPGEYVFLEVQLTRMR